MDGALRSIAAVAIGFAFMLMTVSAGTSIASALFVHPDQTAMPFPPASLPSSYMAAHLLSSAIGAILGGWLAARIATRARFAHAIALAMVLVSMSIASAMTAPPVRQPPWYGPLTSAIGVAGVLLGGSLRAAAAQPSRPPA